MVTDDRLPGLAHEAVQSVGRGNEHSPRPTEGTFPIVSPIDRVEIIEIPDAGSDFATQAADTVVGAFAAWRATTIAERVGWLQRWAALIDEATDDLAAIIVHEMGKPIREARGEVAYASGFARTHAIDIQRLDGHILPSRDPSKRLEVSYQPVGPAVGITPWNFPAAMVMRTVAPALAAGCPIVLKPAEQTPLSALVLKELWHRAGGPPEVFEVVPCQSPAAVGSALIDHPGMRKLTFTGSQAVGSHLYQMAAKHMMRVSMELGGHAPFLVFEDADLDDAVAQVMGCKFRITGQTCVCVNRVLAQESIAGELLERLEQSFGSLVCGNPLQDATQVGPLVDDAGFAKVVEHVDDAIAQGARVHLGGQPVGGLTYEPTLLSDVNDEMKVMREETFGPVLPVATFTTEDEAVERANDSPWGLAAYLATRDLGRAHRVSERLEAGIVGVNDGIPGGDASAPFGGVKQSGVGRAGGRWGLHAYLEPQYRTLRLT